MTTQEQQYARRMARGTLLTHLYRLQDMGLNDPGTPRTATRTAIVSGLGATGMMPPADLEISSLQWLEGRKLVAVHWGLDDHRIYETVTITQEGIDLYEDPSAAQREPGLLLQPRRASMFGR